MEGLRKSGRLRRSRILEGAALALVVMLVGCVEVRVVDDSFETLKEMSDERRLKDRGKGESGGLSRGEQQWAVRVASFSGPKRQQQAHDLMRRLQRQTELSGLWLSNLGGATTLYLGQFEEPGSQQARDAVRRVQRLRLKSDRGFGQARLVTVNRQDEQITDRHNLKAYSGYYTLQVAYYDQTWQGDRRRAAQRNAKTMREQFDISAYYYHGPNLSMVTVGLFGEEQAFEMRPDPISPGRTEVRAHAQQVQQLKQRFPHNYANKARIAKRFKNDQAAKNGQSSELVQVP